MEIKSLKSNQTNEKFVPWTHIDAVKGLDEGTLGSLLKNLEERIEVLEGTEAGKRPYICDHLLSESRGFALSARMGKWLNDNKCGMSILTAVEYAALEEKDAHTLYCIKNSRGSQIVGFYVGELQVTNTEQPQIELEYESILCGANCTEIPACDIKLINFDADLTKYSFTAVGSVGVTATFSATTLKLNATMPKNTTAAQVKRTVTLNAYLAGDTTTPIATAKLTITQAATND